jgi:cell shape-determining protein MreC
MILADMSWTMLIFLFILFGGGSVVLEMFKNFNKTRLEIAQLCAQQQGTESIGREVKVLRDEMEALRSQLSELRDTST